MLTNKVALVTGSTSGIGLGIARTLAARGAHIVFNGFGDPLRTARMRVDLEREHQVQTDYSPADMAHPDQIEAMMQAILQRFGRIDIVVNNAGIQHVADTEQFPTAKWNAILAINLSSAFHTTRLALPSMKQNNWGRIINIASVHGLVGSAQKSAYVAAKHGLIGLTKAVALETAQTGITCNAVCPGWVLTPMVQQQVDALSAERDISPTAAKLALLSQKQPSGEFVTPEQLGGVVAFLCGEDANQVRGVAWNVDGGWVAQ